MRGNLFFFFAFQSRGWGRRKTPAELKKSAGSLMGNRCGLVFMQIVAIEVTRGRAVDQISEATITRYCY